jgi:hypothetical protein
MMNACAGRSSSLASGTVLVAKELRRKTMAAKKMIVAAALLLGATSAALAQSAWTTGSAADRERAGYASPYGSNLYAYAPGFASGHSSGLSAFARIPQTQAGSSDDPALTGGGSAGYNDAIRHDW